MEKTSNTPRLHNLFIENEHIKSFLILYKILYGEDLNDKIDIYSENWDVIRGIKRKELFRMKEIRGYLQKTNLKLTD